MTEDNRMAAIGLMVCAIFSFSVLDAAAKYLVTVAGLPIFQCIWMRFVCHAAFNGLAFGPKAFFGSFRSSTRPLLQVLRGILLFATTGLNFAALQYLQLDQIASIFFLTPFVVAILAGPLLDEWVGWRRFIAILVGFSGVLLITRPGFGGIHWAVSYSFASTFCYACYMILTRMLARHDSSMITQIYSPMAGVVMLAPLGLWVWQWPADLQSWLILLSMGASGGFGHYLLILAHRQAPAPVLAPFSYVGIISQTAMGYLVFAQVPSTWTLAGAAIIIACGLYLLYRERAVALSERAAAAGLSSREGH